MGLLWMMGAEAFALSGTVGDDKGAAVEGALVTLVSDSSVRRITGVDGGFRIDRPVPIRGRASGRKADGLRLGLGMAGNNLQIILPEAAPAGSITFYTIHGMKRVELPFAPLEAGTHQVEMPHLVPGLYSMRLALGRQTYSGHLVRSSNGNTVMLKVPTGRHASPGLPEGPALRREAAAAVDTLLVRKAGFAPARFPVTSYTQAGIEVVLKPDPDAIPPLPPTSDYAAPGPFKTVIESNVGPGGRYTIHRPDPLGKDGFIHAPIIYGYGINGQIRYAADFLKSIASHGFVIIACNVLTGGPNSPANNAAMLEGLNWLLQQNGTPGSKYQGKLAVTRAASMGYSVGGTAAVDIGGHEAIRTVVSIHGHVSSAALHGTLLQTTGTRDNIGLPMQRKTFENSKVQTFLGTVTGADHGYPGTDGGVQRPAIVAWLRYWIYNDAGAKYYFYGNDCVMCKAPWENPQRKHWQ